MRRKTLVDLARLALLAVILVIAYRRLRGQHRAERRAEEQAHRAERSNHL